MQLSPRAQAIVAAGLFATAAFACATPRLAAAPSEQPDLHVVPAPRFAETASACRARAPRAGLRVAPDVEPGARELVNERWSALGIPPLRVVPNVADADVAVRITGVGEPQSYRLRTSPVGIRIDAADADGAFYAMTTLAQLARPTVDGYELSCTDIRDAPALRYRVLSDDVSRGPLPTMRYFKERIRTIASFKMNGYSPYLEDVFRSERRPLSGVFESAATEGITAAQLHELDLYARRFHVALIPEQQTFAHLHGILAWERYAPLAETPHGWLLAPAVPESSALVRATIDEELAAIARPPFFHVGSDEPIDLGRGASRALVEHDGAGAVYLRHVTTLARELEARGIRPMIWDDAIGRNPEMLATLPKSLVFINWHYGSEPSYVPYIARIARAGFDQMIAPGALNWNAIYPDIAQARENIDRFATEGKAAHVLGIFQTVWHDDGETLFEATWYPILYAAASGWESSAVPEERYARDFPRAFFGRDDPAWARDLNDLAAAAALLRRTPAFSGDELFWSDPLDAAVAAHGPNVADAVDLRLHAESVIAHLGSAEPPLHANAAAVMYLAARRYDVLGRAEQIGREARALYADARGRSRLRDARRDVLLFRDLNLVKYLFWERRDALLALEPLVANAWAYENRPVHAASVLARYRIAADRSIAQADAFDRATRLFAADGRALPTFEKLVQASAR